jgi:putative membrane protein
MMVRDHTKANEELKSIASQKNIQLPASMDDQHMNNVNELKKKQGAELDKDYMRDMVDDHEKDVDKFRKQSENGKDSEIKAFAAKTLPVLQMHLDSAKTIRDALK